MAAVLCHRGSSRIDVISSGSPRFDGPKIADGTGKVVRRDRLGGLLGFYYREAA